MALIVVDAYILLALIIITALMVPLAIIALALGGQVIRGRMPGDGAWYLLYGAVTKLGYTKEVLGNILEARIGKSKLKFIVNPAHKAYLWGKPLYILSTEYATSIHPSLLATLTALKELGQDEMVKEYLDLNYERNKVVKAIRETVDEKKKNELYQLLEQYENAIRDAENKMRAFVDKNAHVIEVDINQKRVKDLREDGKQVLIVRSIDPDLIGEYATGVGAAKQSANMDLYAMKMSSIWKSDVVKYAFAFVLIALGAAILFMVLHGQQTVNVQISPEAIKQALNQTAQNAGRVIHA